MRSFLTGDVLEVGAGTGVNALSGSDLARSWTCIEPDAALGHRAAAALALNPATTGCQVLTGTTQTLPGNLRFDALLYIDVLEHIEHDKEELERAALFLRKGGNLIVLSPPTGGFMEYDRSIGHFRRYDRAILLACSLDPAWSRSSGIWIQWGCWQLAQIGCCFTKPCRIFTRSFFGTGVWFLLRPSWTVCSPTGQAGRFLRCGPRNEPGPNLLNEIKRQPNSYTYAIRMFVR